MRPLWTVMFLVFAAAACRSISEAPAPTARRFTFETAPPTRSSLSGPSAEDALARLDTRVPVPLLPMMAHHQKRNMRDHLVAVQKIVAAIGENDFPGIELASKQIGYSEQMGQMCTHMGAGAPGFTDLAIAFHRKADTITDAAQRRDMVAVLSALSETMMTCTGCHATFKQRVVDDAAWTAAIGAAPPSYDGAHAAGGTR